MSTVHTDKSKVEISQNFVAISEYMNFISSVLPIRMIVGLQKILGWLLVSYLVYLKCHIHSRINYLVQLAHDFCGILYSFVSINKKKNIKNKEGSKSSIPLKE